MRFPLALSASPVAGCTDICHARNHISHSTISKSPIKTNDANFIDNFSENPGRWHPVTEPFPSYCIISRYFVTRTGINSPFCRYCHTTFVSYKQSFCLFSQWTNASQKLKTENAADNVVHLIDAEFQFDKLSREMSVLVGFWWGSECVGLAGIKRRWRSRGCRSLLQ